MTPIKVIYIIGAAHSGSTVLGAILGTHPNLLDAGEIYAHGERILEQDNGRCSCGESWATCQFWLEVNRQFSRRFPEIDRQSYQTRMARYQRFRSLPRLYLQRLFPSTNFRIFQAEAVGMIGILIQAGRKSSVVDVSKSPFRGLALATLPEIDLRFLHLVRDGLAIIPSKFKHRGRKWAVQGKSQKALITRATDDWLLENLAAEYVIRATRRPTVRIRYEDLIASPEATILSLSATVGEDLSEVATGVAAGEPISFGHAGGNIAGRNGPRPLIASDDWRSNLTPEAERIFSRQAGWLNRHYGYSHDVKGASPSISTHSR